MIIFLHQGSHSYTHNSLIEHPDLGEIQCHNYDWILNKKKPPKATYIFTDRERMDLWELRVYSELFQYLKNAGVGYRVINDPAKMMNRRSLLRALYSEGLNDFNAYSLTEKILPAKYPVFLRCEHDHAHPLTSLLYNQAELEKALADLRTLGEPDDGILIVEYCAEPVLDTLFRKFSAYKIGNQTLFYNCVFQHNWTVKYGDFNSATDALYEEELSMIRNNAFESIISKAFSIANIDYGRIDFGLVNGRVQTYEINTNPTTKPPTLEHPNAFRQKSNFLGWEKYCQALSALDTTDPSGAFAEKFQHPEIVSSSKTRDLLRVLKNKPATLYKQPQALLDILLRKDPHNSIVRK